MPELLTHHTDDQQRQSLADMLPNGKAWVSKNIDDEDLYKFLKGLSVEFNRSETVFNTIARERDIYEADVLLPLYEKALGIPDYAFSNTEDLATRRRQCAVKLGYSIDTRRSLIELAKLLYSNYNVDPPIELDIRIETGFARGVYPLPYPWTYYATLEDAMFTMYVMLPEALGSGVYPFDVTKYPWPYQSGAQSSLEKLFSLIVPAWVKLVFEYVL